MLANNIAIGSRSQMMQLTPATRTKLSPLLTPTAMFCHYTTNRAERKSTPLLCEYMPHPGPIHCAQLTPLDNSQARLPHRACLYNFAIFMLQQLSSHGAGRYCHNNVHSALRSPLSLNQLLNYGTQLSYFSNFFLYRLPLQRTLAKDIASDNALHFTSTKNPLVDNPLHWRHCCLKLLHPTLLSRS